MALLPRPSGLRDAKLRTTILINLAGARLAVSFHDPDCPHAALHVSFSDSVAPGVSAAMNDTTSSIANCDQ